MENKTQLIYSYSKVWKIEKKIYSFMNLRLPIAINPYDVLAFLGVSVIVMITSKILPFMMVIPSVLRVVVFPYLIATILMKIKLDGKNPIKYMMSCLKYWVCYKGKYVEGYQTHNDKTEKLVLNWYCSKGY